ncbi:hypothetical protein AB0M20_18255 [Actinoplanes sp. NPDC051633]|uniref:hypothetical protein n=1 Tax=Actinoplanes sp. NPDC051633 TaxID=3155670 RepID=UPI0034129915
MSVAMICRSVILAAYLAGLGLSGRYDVITAVAGLAVITIWAAALLRNRYARPAARMVPAMGSAGENVGAGRPKW